MARKKIPWFERALAKSEYVNECLIFNGSTNQSGYGHINVDKKLKPLHRLSYERSKGKIPKDLVIRHTCDTPRCWNPDHLLVGTRLDNSKDMVDRGRSDKPKGIKNANRKLNETQVIEIKNLLNKGIYQKDIASMYLVHQTHISRIKNDVSWRHLKENSNGYNVD